MKKKTRDLPEQSVTAQSILEFIKGQTLADKLI